ncbi:MAG: hypothetical protein ACRYF0_13770 [Janthinobacterium lividum]
MARLGATGLYTQALRVGGSGDDVAVELALDATGQATITGMFASPSIVFGATTLVNFDPSAAPSSDVFVARLNTAGTWTQAVQGGGLADDTVVGVALDPNGSAVIAGSYRSNTAKFGTYTLAGSLTGGTPFVARLGSTGSWTQAVRIESTGSPTYISDVAVNASGSAVVAGLSLGDGTLTFGNYTVDTRGRGNCLFIARLNRVGIWVMAAQTTGPGGTTIARHVALDADGNAAVAGETNVPAAAFGSYIVSSAADAAGNRNFVSFVARLSAVGTWTQVAQTTNSAGNNCYTNALALDGGGNVWLAGQFNSLTASVGSFNLINSDPNAVLNNHFDLYLARLSSAGAWTFATSATNAVPQALALTNGLAVVAGSFTSPAAFGTTIISSPASQAGFLANLSVVVLAAKSNVAGLPACLAWPNPATGSTTLSFMAATASRPVQLLDALGREMRRQELPAHATSLTFSLAGLPGGCYLLRCGTTIGRLVVD